MTIVCLGWGSLVWDPRVLRCGPWRDDGPQLPLEFARTSRDGRLTLVLQHGAKEVPALWTELEYGTPEQAQEALAGREACRLHSIGLWTPESSTTGIGAVAIAQWAEPRGFEAVIWTALPPKFQDRDGHAPTSAEDAIAYLTALKADARERAKEYVLRAPMQIRTEFRSAIQSWLESS